MTADYERWQQLDFVVGIEIMLSNNHTHNGKPFTDICDELKGKYPKDFKFTGWHPQCRCYAIPILMDEETFDENQRRGLKAALRGEEYKKLAAKNAVTDVPDNFKQWVRDHADLCATASKCDTLPNFIKDNQEIIDRILKEQRKNKWRFSEIFRKFLAR